MGKEKYAVVVLILGLTLSALGQPSQPSQKPAFNIEKEVRAYLDRTPPEKKAQSDAYFEGGYWLQLWGFLWGAGIAAVLLQSRLSARMRDLAERITRFKPLQTAAYAIQYLVVATLLSFPLTIYSDFFREHQYGLSNQGFGSWLGDWAKGLLITLILGSIMMMVL